MKTLFLTALLLAMPLFSTYATSSEEEMLYNFYDTFNDMSIPGQTASSATYMRLTASTSVYNRYAIIGFDMSQVSSIRDNISLLIDFDNINTWTDNYFLPEKQTVFHVGVHALKRCVTADGSMCHTIFSDTILGDKFSFIPKQMPLRFPEADAAYLGEILVEKTDKENTLSLDVTDYMNYHVNRTDSIFFVITSNNEVADNCGMYLSSNEADFKGPRLVFGEVSKNGVMQGGRTIYKGEKDSVMVHFPSTATAPFAVKYTDGKNEVVVNDIVSHKYAFEVAPAITTTYTLLTASDANGDLGAKGSAIFDVIEQSVELSGKNTIYNGTSAELSLEFVGQPPFSVTISNDKGEQIVEEGIIANSHVLSVSPSANCTYSVIKATDAFNSTIARLGSAVTISVIDQPVAQLPNGMGEQWDVIFGEEFGASDLDPAVWLTSKGKVEVKNDELHCYITEEGESYTAGQVKMLEKLPTNTDLYIETRLKPLRELGTGSVLTTTSYDMRLSTKYQHRYSMTFPGLWYAGDDKFDINYSLDDWKTFYYIQDIFPESKQYAVRDSLVNYLLSDEYVVFGVEIRKQEIIYYINGVEVKRASQMEGYNTSEFIDKITEVGSPYEDVAEKAYGYYGQDDWKFAGGFAGDFMALFMGANAENSIIEPETVGKSVAIDYFRMYKLKSELNLTPSEAIVFDDELSVQIEGEVVRVDNSLEITEGSATFDLTNTADLSEEGLTYFSTIINKAPGGQFTVMLNENNGTVSVGAVVDKDNQIQAGFDDDPLYYASTVSAKPTGKKKNYYQDGEAYLLVGRIENKNGGEYNDNVSVSLFPIFDNITEPYFYANISGDYGHTNLGNEWNINQRYEISADQVVQVKLESHDAKTTVQKFILGSSFNSVLPHDGIAAIVPHSHYIASGDEATIEVKLKGQAPFSLTYTDGNEHYTINDIQESVCEILVAPTRTSHYTLVSLVDGNGKEGIVFGEATVKVKSSKALSLFPVENTYVCAVQGTQDKNYSTFIEGYIKTDPTYQREAYLRFDASMYDAADSIDVASLSVFMVNNNLGADVKMGLFEVTSGMPASFSDLCWNTKPAEENIILISEISVPNPGFYGLRANWDLSKYLYEGIQRGKTIYDFCLRVTGGNMGSMMKWIMYQETSNAADSIKYTSKFPMLEIDPYQEDNTSIPSVEENTALSLYPNPLMSDDLILNTEFTSDAAVSIYSLSGQKMMETIATSNCVRIDRSLSNGMYIVELRDKHKRFYSKLVLKRP